MIWFYIILCTTILSAALCDSQTNSIALDQAVQKSWNRDRLLKSLTLFSAEPHPLGSTRQSFLALWLEQTANSEGFSSQLDEFIAAVPDPAALDSAPNLMQNLSINLVGRNIYAKLSKKNKPCIVLVASHYDSKRLDQASSVGANDSGSSSAALLEILHSLRTLENSESLTCNVMAIWFDGEEAYLTNWRDGQDRHPAKTRDNLYGSRHLAKQLEACKRKLCLPKKFGGEEIRGLVLLDMIASPNLKLTYDSSSSPELLSLAREFDQSVFKGTLFGDRQEKFIEDDHHPFLSRGVAAINLIDFENLQHWHQPSDQLATLDLSSIEKVSRLAILIIHELSQNSAESK